MVCQKENPIKRTYKKEIGKKKACQIAIDIYNIFHNKRQIVYYFDHTMQKLS